MAINLNNPYGMVGIQPEIGTITPPPTPAPAIPGFTGFGDRLATIGGFGDDPNELKTQEELAKMTQAQIDEYTKQRKMARRSGVSEALIQFGEALQGKPAVENAMKRKQALQNMEMQKQYQAEYQSAIQAAEKTNPAQARLLRSLTLPGYVSLQQKRAEQMLLGGGGSQERFGVYGLDNKLIGTVLKSDQKTIAEIEKNPNQLIGQLRSPTIPTSKEPSINTWAITNAAGDRVTDLVNPTQEELNKEIKAGNFVNKTPVLSTPGKGETKPLGEIKGWNDEQGLQSRAAGYNGLVNSGNRIIKNLYENPESVLTTGDMAQIFNQIGQEITAVTGLINRSDRNTFVDKADPEVKSNFAQLAKDTAITESQLLDFAYQIAKVRGQEGRGLSDQDFKNFQKIISAGRTAEEKASALANFIQGINFEVKSALDYEREIRTAQIARDPDNREANAVIQGIQDVYKVGFGEIQNPFLLEQQIPSAGTPSVEDLLNKYGG
jgi:hypothetical protein